MTLFVDWQPRRWPLMHGSRAMRINGKNNGDPIMDCRQHTLAMKRTESYICDTLNTERSWTAPLSARHPEPHKDSSRVVFIESDIV